ncbi:MAG: GreA/GreB family elongation factor [Candidatus Falkowbacteria bacterium]
MQLPYRKPDKFTYIKPDPNITRARFNEFKEKLERLKTVSQPRAAAEVRRLAEMGDFSENAAYQIAKGKLRGINQRIMELEYMLEHADIIEGGSTSGRVELGSIVTVSVNGKQKTYELLGSSETDPASGIISHNSPLGQALLGRKIGDKVNVRLTDRSVEYQIVSLK